MSQLPPYYTKELDWLKAAQTDDSVTEEEWRTRAQKLIDQSTTLSPALFKKFDALFRALQDADRQRADDAWLHQELKSEPRLVQTDGWVDTYQVGAVTVKVPALKPELGLQMYAAVSRRRDADFTGVCACGAVGTVENRAYIIHHQPDCVASDANLGKALMENGLFLSK